MDKILKHFGLIEEPFSISPNPRYLYLAPQHQEALLQCQYTIESKKGLAIINGDIGTGKTTIARHIYQKYMDNEDYALAMMITPDLKTDTAFLRSIMAEYGVAPKRSHAASVAAFKRFANQSHEHHKNLVLLVDEAQQMTPKMMEVVRVFLNFETDEEKLVQIILFGQNELSTMVDGMRAIKSRAWVFGSLSSMNVGTVKDMIEFRWRAAGGKDAPFPLETVQEIFNYSHGLPREINKLCNVSLGRAFLLGADQVHPTMVVAAAKELRMGAEE